MKKYFKIKIYNFKKLALVIILVPITILLIISTVLPYSYHELPEEKSEKDKVVVATTTAEAPEKDETQKNVDESNQGETPKEEETPNDDATSFDPNRNWNWKADDFRYSEKRAKSNPGYIGSYAMDALAMSFHILWSTTSFSEALLKAVNLRGDADTVGAIVGQIAGIFYGCSHIPASWKKTVTQWDNHEIAYRAYRLYNHLLFSEDVHSLKV